MKPVTILIALTIAACVSAAAVTHRWPAPQHQPSTQYITIQIWSQTVTTDRTTATFHDAEKLAEFHSDGSWSGVKDLSDEQKRIIAQRLRIMLNNWVEGQGLDSK